MEVAVFISLDAWLRDQSVFKRQVLCPDAFDVKAFVHSCKAIFGNDCIVDILFT